MTAGKTAEDKPTLMLLDGNSLAFRAFYALPAENFKTKSGLTTNAVYGFTAMLINLLRDEAPTHIAAAFDVSRQTFRASAIRSTRRAGPRLRTSSAARSTSPRKCSTRWASPCSRGRLRGRRHHRDPGVSGRRGGYRVLVVTGDRDALQLVNSDITVLYPIKGVSTLTRFTPDAVVEKYGLTPQQYPDFAALRGDPSDNLPGIPGVGEKTAAKWIVEYGSLQGLVDNADAVRGKVGDALRANLSTVHSQPGADPSGARRSAGPDP